MEGGQPAVLKRMRSGECPASPEEWKELAEFMASVAKFLGVINLEMDYIGHALDVTEPILEILAGAADQDTKDKLRKVVEEHDQESHGLPMPPVQEEDGLDSDSGPLEPGGGRPLP